MKYVLIACCLFIMVSGAARAQVTKYAFIEKVNALSLSINKKNTQGVSNVSSILDNMMTNQINYLNFNIIAMAKKYLADTTKANADLKSARSAPDPNSPQMISARNEAKQVAAELSAITQFKNNLATDKGLYNSILLFKRNIAANETGLLNYLNQFAATLQ